MLLPLAAAAILLPAAFLTLMFNLQEHMIFPTHAVASAGPLPTGSERFDVSTPDGQTLAGVHIKPAHATGEATLVLSFAGNAWNSQAAATYIHQLYPNVDVIGFHYRGYRPSTGDPSAQALLADSELIFDFAVKRLKAKHVVAVGLSIGSGVAAHLASKRPLDGVILVTPFDSLKAVASGYYPFLPVSALFRHEMDSATALRETGVRAAIIAAEHDDLIVPKRTESLRKSIKNLVFDETISRAGHNDIYHSSQFQHAMRQALTAVTR